MANSELEFRTATEKDLDCIVKMLSDDGIGKTRERYEQPLPECYHEAFQAIQLDPNNELLVAQLDGELVGVLQITYTPYIVRQGSWRATIEGVRIDSSTRGKGVGSQLVQRAIQRAQERGCHMVQLTSDKKREEALRFYEQQGFQATHEGLKLFL